MRIAVTTSGPGWDATVDQRFGRAAGFAIVDLDSGMAEPQFIANKQDMQAQHGAGLQAAEHVVAQAVAHVLSGHVGPKAYRALTLARVTIHLGIQGTVRQAVDDFLAGRLRKADGPDSAGHA